MVEAMEVNGSSNIIFTVNKDSPPSDPKHHPVIILGQLVNLNKINYEHIKHKLEPRVSEEIYITALQGLHPNTGDTVPLYLNSAVLGSLPARCSRHNSSARPHAISSLVKSLSLGISESVIIVCPYGDVMASVAAVARSYPLFSLKSKSLEDVHVRLEFILTDLTDSDGILDLPALQAVADSVRLAASIVDRPCNMMTVSSFLKEIETVSKENNLEFKVIRGEELKESGLGGIYGVGKAAIDPPALAILTYKPKCEPETTMAWVGKGIVYDTGGLSIKTKTMMPGMKRDCGGAAAVLGALAVVAKTGSRALIHGVFCLAENAVGPKATRPDDVHVLYSGRTVEINNTDAEGRLVLADGVVYASRNLNAKVIIDVATLTGAQGIATGKYHGGLLTNSVMWELRALQRSLISGDLLFPLVFSPELHFSEFNSSVADMKNSVADRGNAQPSCAGLFILSHLGFDTAVDWLHIDMASPVHQGERATGYGVSLLTMLSGHHSQSEMIEKLCEVVN